MRRSWPARASARFSTMINRRAREGHRTEEKPGFSKKPGFFQRMQAPMSAPAVTTSRDSPRPAAPGPPPAPPTPVAFHYTQTESFVALLNQLGASLLVTTYQANKLLVVRAQQGGISTLVRTFDQPMGVAVDARRLT